MLPRTRSFACRLNNHYNEKRHPCDADMADRSVVLCAMRAILFLPFLLLLAAPAWAEAPKPVAPSVDGLQQLLDTLQDDKARAQFVRQLQTMIEARRVAATSQPSPSPAGWLSERADQLKSEILEGASVVVDIPRVIAWGRMQIEDDTARWRWLEIALAVLIVFGCAGVAEWLVRRFLLRLLPRAPTRASTRGARLLFALLGLVVDALPI